MSDTEEHDPYLWLEEVEGEAALEWSSKLSDATKAELGAEPGFEALGARLLAMYDSKDKIPFAGKRGQFVYNFWQDEHHEQGIWRRTTLSDFRSKNPVWETVLDVDRLSEQDGTKWVWHGASFLEPGFERCLVSLSRGGSDASVVREFDLTTREFVVNGFSLPEAKGGASYRDLDTLYVATDFGPGSLTRSGYPRIVKEWRRGEPLESARTVFEGEAGDISVGAGVSRDRGIVREFVSRAKGFYEHVMFLRRGDALVPIPKPDDANLSTFGEFALLELRSDWTTGDCTYRRGSLLVTRFDELFEPVPRFEVLFSPNERSALSGVASTHSRLLINFLENVRAKMVEWYWDGTTWQSRPIADPPIGEIFASGVDPDGSDEYFAIITSPTTPTTLSIGSAGHDELENLYALPEFFESKGVEVSQKEAISRDGERVPYFLIGRPSAEPVPTLLYGYGGFEASITPGYSPQVGAAWLERGYAFVLSNIRGGGEFGPRWHQAALRGNRQRAYDDFIAVAEHLTSTDVTRPSMLGISGASNGGLLVAVALTQRPDLFGAVVCKVPITDMRRYHRLLAGASWMDEYGNPDEPEDWAFLSQYSPYHRLRAGPAYPPTLVMTSTRDDRVHPGHARKLVARLQELGAPVFYYENTEGGHGGSANHEQAALMDTMTYTFLAKRLAR
jgi:prolyl oligopeptidase